MAHNKRLTVHSEEVPALRELKDGHYLITMPGTIVDDNGGWAVNVRITFNGHGEITLSVVDAGEEDYTYVIQRGY